MRDSDLQASISGLERELAIKKGYQAVKFVLPKSTPDDVATEIQNKLREIAEGLALTKTDLSGGDTSATSVFTADEVLVLKMLISVVEKKTNGSSQVEIPTIGGVPVKNLDGKASPGGASTHSSTSYGPSKKARIVTAENVRGEAKRFAAPEDEVFVANPEKVDEHGMVSATHMKKGMMMKIPLDDIEFLS